MTIAEQNSTAIRHLLTRLAGLLPHVPPGEGDDVQMQVAETEIGPEIPPGGIWLTLGDLRLAAMTLESLDRQPPPIALRAEVAEWAALLELRLRQHDYKGGWADLTLPQLALRLAAQSGEVAHALAGFTDSFRAILAALDATAYGVMIGTNSGTLSDVWGFMIQYIRPDEATPERATLLRVRAALAPLLDVRALDGLSEDYILVAAPIPLTAGQVREAAALLQGVVV